MVRDQPRSVCKVPRAGTSQRHVWSGTVEPRTCDGAAMEREVREEPTLLSSGIALPCSSASTVLVL